MPKNRIKKLLIVAWLTALCFLVLSSAYAWDVPSYLRFVSGTRLWFSAIEGDLIQNDRTKLGITYNLGIRNEELVWEFYTALRMKNIHLFRMRVEPSTLYNYSSNQSYHLVRNLRLGYDLDFYMTPQVLFGANIDLDVHNLHTSVNNVPVGGMVYTYGQNCTRAIPSVGLHGTFYPIITGIALRPNISARVGWWGYDGLENRDGELAAAVDIPINQLWTWTIASGYRIWNTRVKRERDTVDTTRKGFFVETSVLF